MDWLIWMMDSFDGWTHSMDGLIQWMDSFDGWTHLKDGLIQRMDSFEGWTPSKDLFAESSSFCCDSFTAYSSSSSHNSFATLFCDLFASSSCSCCDSFATKSFCFCKNFANYSSSLNILLATTSHLPQLHWTLSSRKQWLIWSKNVMTSDFGFHALFGDLQSHVHHCTVASHVTKTLFDSIWHLAFSIWQIIFHYLLPATSYWVKNYTRVSFIHYYQQLIVTKWTMETY